MRQGRSLELPKNEAFENSPLRHSSVVAAFLVSKDGRLLWANALFLELLGVESPNEVIGRPLLEVIGDRKDWAAWRDDALTGRSRRVSITLKGRNGRSVLLRGDLLAADRGERRPNVPPANLFGAFVDVTEELNLRSAVQRSARMEALGSLTSGIAHDFNNLLTVLVGNLYLVAEELREHPKSFAKLKSARDAAKRGADLIRQLLSFAKREAVDTDVVDPAEVIRRIEPLLSRALGQRITLDARLQPEAGSTRCNGAQLESVLVNLSVNARDAIESNGTITISLESVQLNRETAGRHKLESGSYLRLTVADDGAGIPQAAMSRVFEPFFHYKGGSRRNRAGPEHGSMVCGAGERSRVYRKRSEQRHPSHASPAEHDG